jgi:hypothetical protein
MLLRQYVKTGGKLLAFNVDGGFSHGLDAGTRARVTSVAVRVSPCSLT